MAISQQPVIWSTSGSGVWFLGSANLRASFIFTPTDPCSHGNEIWDRMGYDLARVYISWLDVSWWLSEHCAGDSEAVQPVSIRWRCQRRQQWRLRRNTRRRSLNSNTWWDSRRICLSFSPAILFSAFLRYSQRSLFWDSSGIGLLTVCPSQPDTFFRWKFRLFPTHFVYFTPAGLLLLFIKINNSFMWNKQASCVSHSHGSVSVVRTTFKVYGKMQNLTLSQPKTPEPIVTKF